MFSNGKNIDDKYINIDEVNNIMNRIIEDKNKFEQFINIANKCENKEYNINDNLFIKNIVDNFGVDIWNDIYKNYKYEESDLYNKSYVPTHSFGGYDDETISEDDDDINKTLKENRILKYILIVLSFLIIIIFIIIIIVLSSKQHIIKEPLKGTYKGS